MCLILFNSGVDAHRVPILLNISSLGREMVVFVRTKRVPNPLSDEVRDCAGKPSTNRTSRQMISSGTITTSLEKKKKSHGGVVKVLSKPYMSWVARADDICNY
uniref:Uncharacterized protein n=1 Tax=Nelumbo nucifera TaxID=4432 RepID=A0A822ZPG1_NELNU|nr:TPA_asm: hypothetical protein HUJ06_003615 [Nelumbo nucifera]